MSSTTSKHDTELSKAIQTGTLPTVHALLRTNLQAINQYDEYGKFPLYLSCRKENCLAVTKFLIESGADVNQRTKEKKRSPLWKACLGGHFETVVLLVESGADVNLSAASGTTPLWVASQNGHSKIVRFLLRHKATVDARHNDGRTALWQASQNGHSKVVARLLQHNAIVDDDSQKNRVSPLWQASGLGHCKVVSVLLQYNAHVDHQHSENGTTPLIMASYYGHLTIVQRLLEAKATCDLPAGDGTTAFIRACQRGHLKVALLLKTLGGANVDHRSKAGVNAVFAAASCGHLDIVKEYATKDRVSAKVDTGHNSLHAGIFLSEQEAYHLFRKLPMESFGEEHKLTESKPKTHIQTTEQDKIIKTKPKAHVEIDEKDKVEVIKVLAENVDDINEKTHHGETALYLSSTQGYTQLAKQLYSHGADVTMPNFAGINPLSAAVVHGKLTTSEWLLFERKVLVNSTDDGGRTALYFACQSVIHVTNKKGQSSAENFNAKIVQLLIDKGANVNQSNMEKTSPLAIASKVGNAEAVKLLIQNEAKIDSVDCEGRNALHEASEAGHATIISILLPNGADANIQDHCGDTALHKASRRLHTDSVKVLSSSGCNPNIQNHWGESPLHIVASANVQREDVEGPVKRANWIMDVLMSHGADISLQNPRTGLTVYHTAILCANKEIATAIRNKQLPNCPITLEGQKGESFEKSHEKQLESTLSMGRTLIHLVVLKHSYNAENLDLALNTGIDINCRDCNGQTCLHLAVLAQHLGRTVDAKNLIFLVKKGADIMARDKCAFTPLTYAARFPMTFSTLFSLIQDTNCISSDDINNIMKIAHFFRTSADIVKILMPHGLMSAFCLEKLPQCELEKVSLPNVNMEELLTFRRQLWGSFTTIPSFCKNLLQRFGQVCDDTHTKKIWSCIDDFVSNLCQKIGKDFLPYLAGSMREGTKVGQPDEGDYVLRLSDLKADMFEKPEVIGKSFVRLLLKPEHRRKFNEILTPEGYLNRNLVFKKVYGDVSKVVDAETIWSEFPELFRLTNTDIQGDDQSIRHLDLYYHDDLQPWLHVDVDLTPTVVFPDWYPDSCRQHSFHQQLLSKYGCQAAAKWMASQHDDPSIFRLSFEKAITHMLRKMPNEYKQAYILGKIFIGMCPYIKDYIVEPKEYIPSFHLKVGVLWLYFDDKFRNGETQSSGGIDKIAKLTKAIFVNLADAYQKQWLEDFFVPDYNLLLNDKYGQYGWCASNYCRIIVWLMKKDEDLQLITDEDCMPKVRQTAEVLDASQKIAVPDTLKSSTVETSCIQSMAQTALTILKTIPKLMSDKVSINLIYDELRDCLKNSEECNSEAMKSNASICSKDLLQSMEMSYCNSLKCLERYRPIGMSLERDEQQKLTEKFHEVENQIQLLTYCPDPFNLITFTK